MKQKTFMSIGLVGVMLITAVCGCSVFEDEQFVPKKYAGEWEWTRATGGIMGKEISADTAGYSMSLVITQANKAVWYKNGEVLERYKVVPADKESGVAFSLKPVNSETEHEISKSVVMQGNKLMVYDNCFDCFSYEFMH